KPPQPPEPRTSDIPIAPPLAFHYSSSFTSSHYGAKRPHFAHNPVAKSDELAARSPLKPIPPSPGMGRLRALPGIIAVFSIPQHPARQSQKIFPRSHSPRRNPASKMRKIPSRAKNLFPVYTRVLG